MNGIIYQWMNPLREIYIGQTSRPIERRLSEYKRLAVSEEKHQRKLQSSFKKYGIENHTFKILVSGVKEQTQLDALEQYYILVYDSFRHGLNSNRGGRYKGNKLSSDFSELIGVNHQEVFMDEILRLEELESLYKNAYNDVLECANMRYIEFLMSQKTGRNIWSDSVYEELYTEFHINSTSFSEDAYEFKARALEMCYSLGLMGFNESITLSYHNERAYIEMDNHTSMFWETRIKEIGIRINSAYTQYCKYFPEDEEARESMEERFEEEDVIEIEEVYDPSFIVRI